MLGAYGDCARVWWWSCCFFLCYWTCHHDELLNSHQGDLFCLKIQNEFQSARTAERHPATGHTATSDPRLDSSTAPSAGFSWSTAAPHSGACTCVCVCVCVCVCTRAHMHYFLYLCTWVQDGLQAGQSGVDLGFDTQSRQDIFLFSQASRPALWFTQPHIQCALGALSAG